MGNERLYGEPIISHIMDMKIQTYFYFFIYLLYCIYAYIYALDKK